MKYLFTALIVLFSDIAFCQTNFGFTDAKIVYKKGDSVLCLIKRELNYGDVITYKTNQDADEQQVRSKFIKSIQIDSKYIENITLDKKERLATLIVSGKLTLFKYNDIQKGDAVKMANSNGGRFSAIRVIEHYVVKNGDIFTEIKEKSFEKDLKSILADCATVITKIDNQQYAFADMQAIIEQYNSCND